MFSLSTIKGYTTRHLIPEKLPMPDARFDYVHLDLIGSLPPSRGYRYCLTLMDRFSRWPKTVPLPDITADTVIKCFFTTWITRFGSPKIITTDRGIQFESNLFEALIKLIGTKCIKTMAYHLESNGLVKRWHKCLKAAIMQWVDTLPIVLIGFRTCYKENSCINSRISVW